MAGRHHFDNAQRIATFMLSLSQAQDRAQSLVEQAMRAGADAADALYACNASTGISVRLGVMEDV